MSELTNYFPLHHHILKKILQVQIQLDGKVYVG